MGVVNTSQNFNSTDTITSAKMNNIIDETTFTGDAIQGTTLQVVSPGKLAVSAGGITSNELASQSVTPAKLSNSDFGDFTVSSGVATIDNSVITPAKLSEPFTSGTAVTASGSSIDFTGIPSWVKRITVMFDKVSANGTSPFLIQLGDSGGFETSGYESFITIAASTVTTDSTTAGFRSGGGIAARGWRGMIQVCLLSGNTWVASGTLNDLVANNAFVSGSKTLSDTLTQVRFTTVNGTDTFDAGSVNIMYE
jgi:hypothetical protein